jgi:queuine tRNA-ribosyltransferase
VRFTVHATDGPARLGALETAHGIAATPVFMPVGTRGTVRTQPLSSLLSLDAPILLANTYHLMQRPGPTLFERTGGLHAWMKWPRAILTDSGGFQVFSLPGVAVDDDGVTWERVRLTPEHAMAMQRAIGSDIAMVLDHCIASTGTEAQARDAMVRTHAWAARSLAAHRRFGDGRACFGIVQGAQFPVLRRESAHAIASLPFDGFAIGGLAVGETRAEREDLTAVVTERLPRDRPRYLMGVGTPLDVLEGVARGVDLFDCILPTAAAQHGHAFTSRGKIDLARGVHAFADEPLDPACGCPACTTYARSYLHHLVKCEEPLGWQLLAFHNLAFYARLTARIRAALAAGRFAAFYATEREALARADIDNPPGKHPRVKPTASRHRGAFELAESPAGFTSVRHVPSGEVMHSVNAPDEEAARIYIAQSAVIARALAGEKPITVWDVGLGAAHNAMALVRAHEAAAAPSPILLVSFERDLDALRLALAHTGPFPHLRHAAPHKLVLGGAYAGDGLAWELREGDFLETLAAAPPPDVIFYDPFSTRTDGPLWTEAAFRAIAARLAGPAELFTYSAARAVRDALAAAGATVAAGVASGPKPETTIARWP